jgi:4-hydroxy-tetrahydrodipicolinate reductase
MPTPVRTAIIGSGRAARHAIDMVTAAGELELVAVTTAREDIAGADIATLSGGPATGIALELGNARVLDPANADLVLHCSSASRDDLLALVAAAARSGSTFVTVSGCIHPGTAFGADAARIAADAEQSGARIAGAGINPGFLLDVLPAAAASALADPRQVVARRTTDMSRWGQAMREAVGFGDGPATARIEDVWSLDESLALVCDSLGFEQTGHRIEVEHLRPPAGGDYPTARDGRVGFLQRGTAECRGGASVVLEWVAVLGAAVELYGAGTTVTVTDSSGAAGELRFQGQHDHDAYPATLARARFAARRLLFDLPAGLYDAALRRHRASP